MRHFLFEEKEYKINPQFKRKKNEEDSAQALARALQRKSRRGGGGRSHARSVDARQNCVVKAQYSKSLEAHKVQLEKYLVREGTEIDGSGAKLYGTDIEEYRQNMTDKNFRVFLSPQSREVDLKSMAEQFVEKLQLQTGYKLFWQGANHYNTAHPHAHLLINGVDKTGKEVTLPRDVIKTFMRETAKDICTDLIGLRTSAEIALDQEKELDAPRYTRMDKVINELCVGNRINLSRVRQDQSRVQRRLEALRKMNLCVFKDGEYHMGPRWKDDLQANGRYNAFLQSREALRFTAPSALQVYSGSRGTVTGKVARVFRTDGDASDNHAMVIEGLDGKAYFVPLFRKPEVKDGEQKVVPREGDLLSIRTYENQKGRLTPVMTKRDPAEVLREIKKQGITGRLAESIMAAAAKVATPNFDKTGVMR